MHRWLAGLAVGLALAGCSPDNGGSGSAGGAKYDIAVIPKGLGHQFWLTVKAGADAAGKEYNANIIWNGPAQETEIAEQINILQDMIARGVDAVVIAACDAHALVDPIHNALDAGVPVITIDSGIESDRPLSFVATDNVAAAKAAADVLADLIGGEGKVGVMPIVPGAATSEMREQGFREGAKAHPGMVIATTLFSYSDSAKAMAAAEDMLTANPDLAGIFVENEAGCIGAVQAVKAAGKAGQVKLVAFDAAEQQIEALKDGTVQALVVQNPFQMGYQGVKAAIDHIEGREIPKRIDTGVTIVTQENLNDPDVQALLHPEGA